MKTLVILDGDYSTDIRVRKEVKLLQENTDNITIICTKLSKNKEESRINTESIVLLKSNKFSYFCAKVIERAFFFNPLIYFSLNTNPHFKKAKTIYVHDLPLAKTVNRLKKSNFFSQNIPKLVIDLHEVWPHALQDWHSNKSGIAGFFHRIIHNVKRWEKFEQEAVRTFDHVVVVTEEMKHRLKKLHDVENEKISVIENSEYYSKNLANKINKISLISDKSVTSFGYVGGIGEHRGLSQLIEAFIFDESIRSTCRLNIFGGGDEEHIEFLKGQINQYQLENIIEFFGYVPTQEIFTNKNYKFDIGCIPHLKSGHTDNTIPHKLFQYAQRGLPILSSNCNPLEKYLKKYPLKAIFKSGDIYDLSKKIHQITETRKEFALKPDVMEEIDQFNQKLCFSRHRKKFIDIISN